MKKFHTLICLFAIHALTVGQTYFMLDFTDNQMPPDGWTIENLESGWDIYESNYAGGTVPEGYFGGWQTGTSNTTRLISPSIDLSGLDVVTFQYKEWIQPLYGGFTIGVATHSDGGDWNVEREITATGTTGPDEITLEISNDDVGSSNFQICFFVEGNTENLAYWMIDDITLFHQIELDASMIELNTPKKFYGSKSVEGVIKNFGASDISSLQINWQVDEGDIYTTNIDELNLAFGDTYSFTCDDSVFLPPSDGYNLSVWIETVNGVTDENPDNNQLDKVIDVASHSILHRPCIEEFSHSSCSPCALFNEAFFPWLEEHDEQVTFIKYPTCWDGPVTGDPYCTDEVESRVEWYDVVGVPWAFIDGSYTISDTSAIQEIFEESILDQGFIKINGTRSTVTAGNTDMDVEVTLLPFVGFEEVIIHVFVFEYITTENVGTNGETEFHHILMKMVPDELGTVTGLSDRTPFTISETVELEGTYIEEWDDLGIIVIVQDEATKYIWQSTYIEENASLSTDATLSDLTVNGASIEGFSPDIFEYTIWLSEGTTDIPVVDAVVSDATATKIIVPANEFPGSTTVDVFAEDLTTSNTYTVIFDVEAGIGTEAIQVVQINPNPTTEFVKIMSDYMIQSIRIYDQTGNLRILSDVNGNQLKLNINDLERGLYLVRIETHHKVYNQKIVVQ